MENIDKKKLLFSYLRVLIFFLPFLLSGHGNAQSLINSDFGKNRIQHKEFDWYFYRADAYDVYYYVGGKDLASYVMLHADEHIRDIEEFLDYRGSDRLVFVLYNSLNDLRQTNMGFSSENDNPGGTTPIVGNKAFLYFDGNHFKFINNLRSAITQILLNEMLYGGSIQERIQNAALLSLPDWYIKGLIDYSAESWNPEEQAKLKSGILSGRLRKFGNLRMEEKVLVSKSMWKYVSDVYGRPAVSNIIYLTRINKSFESGYIFVLGKGFNELFREWYRYYRNEFKAEERMFVSTQEYLDQRIFPRRGVVSSIRLSPRGDYLAFTHNYLGRKRVFLYDLVNKKRKKIFSYDHKSNTADVDYTYPLIDFHPFKKVLTYVYEDKSHPVFVHYDYEKKGIEDERTLFRLEKVLDFNYADNGRFIALSGIKNGQSDIYVFNWLSNALRPVTNDIYDDLNPSFVRNSDAIVFTSNRPELDLGFRNRDPLTSFNNNFDVFYYDYKNQAKELKRLSQSYLVDELHTGSYDDTAYFSYLVDDNGIINRNATYLDSIYDHTRVIVGYTDTANFKNDTFIFDQPNLNLLRIPDSAFQDTGISLIDTLKIYRDTFYTYRLTNYGHSILDYEIVQSAGKVVELFQIEGKYKVKISPVPRDIPNSTVTHTPTSFTEDLYRIRRARAVSATVTDKTSREVEIKTPRDSSEIDISDYYFQSDFVTDSTIVREKEETENLKTGKTQVNNRRRMFGPSRIYFLSFTPDYFTSQIDNSIYNTPYLRFNQQNPQPFVYNPVLNAMFKLGVSDLFQDYRIVGGIRIHGNLRGADYQLSFNNLKRRLDKRITFFRQGMRRQNQENQWVRETTHEGRYALTWPFSVVSSVKGDFFIRRDNTTILSTEQATLEADGQSLNWAGIKLQYVFDNTLDWGINLKSGTRFKFYTETFQGFDFKQENPNTALFFVYGGDFRKYFKFLNHIVWANRVAFASSIGDAKVAYVMGGVDNWLFPRFNRDVQFDDSVNYVYKALSANMRGFKQNIRNGNTYSLINTELRIPVFRLFTNKPIVSTFTENFQIVGFADIGTAWTGKNPFSEDNSLNKRIIEQKPLRVTIINLTNPIVMGYGVGFHGTLFGYFVRVDFAWGMEDFERVSENPMLYISLGYDF